MKSEIETKPKARLDANDVLILLGTLILLIGAGLISAAMFIVTVGVLLMIIGIARAAKMDKPQ